MRVVICTASPHAPRVDMRTTSAPVIENVGTWQGQKAVTGLYVLSTSTLHVDHDVEQGLVNVLIEHHPNIADIISNKYLKVMFKLPKIGHVPSPVESLVKHDNPKSGNFIPMIRHTCFPTLLVVTQVDPELK